MYHTYDTDYMNRVNNSNEYPTSYGYQTYWNIDAASLNPSLKNLQLSQNNLYLAAMNRSYDLNLNTLYPDQYSNNSRVINNFQNMKSSNNELTNYPVHNNNQFMNGNRIMPGYQLNQGPNKRFSNYEYHMNEYLYNGHLTKNNINNNINHNQNDKLLKNKTKNRNFKIYFNETNESGESYNTTEIISSDQDDLESEYDTFEEYNKLFSKQLSKDTIKLLERNQGALSMLIEGDIIEYVVNEDDYDTKDYKHFWAIYMGNSMIMRFDIKENNKKQIVYESYWKVANENNIYINKDLDKRLTTLPIYETLYRARNAHTNNKKFNKKFSSDKNFALWCRFDINKSDIEFATDKGYYSSSLAKVFLIEKFMDRLGEAKELKTKTDKNIKKKSPVKKSVKIKE